MLKDLKDQSRTIIQRSKYIIFLVTAYICRSLLRVVYAHLERALYSSAASRRITPATTVSIGDSENLAVIATHTPTADYKLLLASLRRANYKIIGYTYTPDDGLFEPEDLVLHREVKYGRDFLAYKHACAMLSTRDYRVKKVLFANDSFFVTPGVDNVTNWFAATRAEWCGFTLNMREHFHIGSYLFQVQGCALNETILFMKRYRPMNTRYHTIHFGETALSFHLIQSGFAPAAYVYETGILDAFRADWASGIAQGEEWALELYEKLPRDGAEYRLSQNPQYNAGQISRFMESENISKRVGFYLFKDGRVPLLKRDVFYRSSADSFFSAPVVPDITASETWSSIHGRRRYLRSASRIRRFLELLDD